jgi:ArsR family transcriptional regulator, zinc-responsive transcriptional repressor
MNSSAYNVFFKNLANPLKIKIILELRKSEMNVTDLSRVLSVEQSKVSHALILLKNCNIVRVSRKGKERIYFLNKDTIIPMLKLIDKHAQSFCDCKECKGCRK